MSHPPRTTSSTIRTFLMAKKAAKTAAKKKPAAAKSAEAKSVGGRALVIVESPAKARTIGKFLGRDYVIEASIGHVRDLPEGAKQIPAQYKAEAWSRLGVNVDDEFKPIYIVPPEKSEQVKK